MFRVIKSSYPQYHEELVGVYGSKRCYLTSPYDGSLLATWDEYSVTEMEQELTPSSLRPMDPDRFTLFLSDIHKYTTKEEIIQFFSSTVVPQRVTILRQGSSKSPTSSAYVQFKNEEEVKSALTLHLTLLHGQHISMERKSKAKRLGFLQHHQIKKSQLDCNGAQEGKLASSGASASPRKIVVGNLRIGTTKTDLWNLFSDCGEIELIRIMEDNTTATVHYGDAKSCLEALLRDGAVLNGVKIKVVR